MAKEEVKKGLVVRIRAIIEDLKSIADEPREKEIADAVIDLVEVLASNTKTKFDDLICKMLRRFLDVPDRPDYGAVTTEDVKEKVSEEGEATEG